MAEELLFQDVSLAHGRRSFYYNGQRISKNWAINLNILA